MRRLMLAPLTALLLAPAAAQAAEPETATVSAASPKAAWTGTLEHPYPFHNAFNYEPTLGTTGSLPCEAPGCDTFTLEVADSADLTFLVQSEQTSEISLRVQNPAGEWTYVDGWSDGAKPTTYKVKKAPTGSYVVNVVARVFGSTNPTAVDDTADYTGSAVLAVPAPSVLAPAPAVAPPAEPATTPAPKRKKLSCKAKARKLKKAKKRKAALKRCAKRRKQRR